MPLTNDISRALHELPDMEKQMLVDELLTQLDHPDPEMDYLWLAEVHHRRQEYKTGNARTYTLEEVIEKYRPTAVYSE